MIGGFIDDSSKKERKFMQIYMMIGILLAFAALGIGLYFSTKKHEAKMAASKKKKGRNKYMPEIKNPGRR